MPLPYHASISSLCISLHGHTNHADYYASVSMNANVYMDQMDQHLCCLPYRPLVGIMLITQGSRQSQENHQPSNAGEKQNRVKTVLIIFYGHVSKNIKRKTVALHVY